MSGGGVLTEAAATARSSSFGATGAGRSTVDGTQAEVHDASIVATGAGVAFVTSAGGRQAAVDVLGDSPEAFTDVTVTGGGIASLNATTERMPSIVANGGSAAVMAWLGEHYAELAATGGGSAWVIGINGEFSHEAHSASVIASGGGRLKITHQTVRYEFRFAMTGSLGEVTVRVPVVGPPRSS